MDKKYVIFESKLNQLLYSLRCDRCKHGHISELSKSLVGTMLSVKVVCVCGNTVTTWHSQPSIGQQPVGNLLTCASIIFGGKTYEDFNAIANLLNLQFMSDVTFYSIQDAIILPTINTFYENDMQDVRESHTGHPLTICGDGRCDSPGYSARILEFSKFLFRYLDFYKAPYFYCTFLAGALLSFDC